MAKKTLNAMLAVNPFGLAVLAAAVLLLVVI